MAGSVVLSVALILGVAVASPLQELTKRAVNPTVASSTLLGVASDPFWSRDSCTSVLVQFRELWTCRDSSGKSGKFYSSTASWSNFTSPDHPDVVNGVLTLYGNNPAEYYTVQKNECGSPAGNCGNDTRWAIWQDSRPLPVPAANNIVSMYTWITNSYLNNTSLAPLNGNPPTSLYKNVFAATESYDQLPSTQLLNEQFWPANGIPYGAYGWVLDPTGTTAYLYGQLSKGSNRTVARVPVAQIETRSAYTFWNGTGFGATLPSLTDQTVAIPHVGTGGQGTFYYSDYFKAYVWIGGPGIGVGPQFFISTAPAPQGPWTVPKQFYSGYNGNSGLGSYSQQAHPGLSQNNGNGNDIFLTFTQVNKTGYNTPLIHVVWE